MHSRTLALTDEVLCVCYTRTQEAEKLLIAVALLDSTVKVRGWEGAISWYTYG